MLLYRQVRATPCLDLELKEQVVPWNLLAGGFAVTAVAWYQSRTNAAARLLFRASLLYLPIFMAALLFHRVPNTEENRQRVAARLSRLTAWGAADSDTDWELVDRPSESKADPGIRKPSYHSIALAPFPFLPCPSALAYPEHLPRLPDSSEQETKDLRRR